MLRNTVLSFITIITFFVTANASTMGITVSNTSNTIVTLRCTNCVECSTVTVMPMGKVVFDCVPSNIVGGAYDLQYIYTQPNGSTIEGEISAYLGETLIISRTEADLLVFAVSQ